VIILSPEMRQNSPTAISDFKIFPGEKPPDPVKRGMGRGGKRKGRGKGGSGRGRGRGKGVGKER